MAHGPHPLWRAAASAARARGDSPAHYLSPPRLASLATSSNKTKGMPGRQLYPSVSTKHWISWMGRDSLQREAADSYIFVWKKHSNTSTRIATYSLGYSFVDLLC